MSRPLPELPRVRYEALTRRRPREAVASLVRALVAHGDDWKRDQRATSNLATPR